MDADDKPLQLKDRNLREKRDLLFDLTFVRDVL